MKHVLLALGWYDRLLHEGVAAYASEHGWHLNSDMFRRPGKLPNGWEGDGILAHIFGSDFVDFFESTGAPCVNVQNRSPRLTYPLVATNIVETAKMAFAYFRGELGFRYFGAYGTGGSQRIVDYQQLVESKGHLLHTLPSRPWDLKQEGERVRNWLKSVPLPIAVFCNNDDEASRLIHLACSSGFDIPEQVAVLGVDNTPLVCQCSRVPLSSVDTNLFEVGYQAASLLDHIMEGGSAPNDRTLITPKGISERASTDTLIVESKHVREAIDLMRREFGNGITVTDVVAESRISHDGLKKAFRRNFGKAPSVILREMRMKEAGRLLLITEEKIQTICRLVGMGNEKHFTNAFKRHFGMPPRQYRKTQGQMHQSV